MKYRVGMLLTAVYWTERCYISSIDESYNYAVMEDDTGETTHYPITRLDYDYKVITEIFCEV